MVALNPALETSFVLVASFAGLLMVALVFLFAARRLLKPWLRAMMGGARMGVSEIIGMRLRRTDLDLVLDNLIRARQAGVPLSAEQLERHHLAGGHVPQTVTAMIAARAAGLHADWEVLAAMDLRGQDVVAFARSAIESEWDDATLAEAAKAEAPPAPAPAEAPAQLRPAADRSDLAAEAAGRAADLVRLVGAGSTTESFTPPAGRVVLDGNPVAAIAAKGPIERGVPVEIVGIATCVVVRPRSK